MFSHIFLDSPPIAAVADYDLLMAAADGVILVAQPDHTDRKLLFRALEVLPKEKLIGVVINGVKPWLFDRQNPNYYYYRSDGDTI
jgi:Mrp family chromosome partitioning ATPase